MARVRIENVSKIYAGARSAPAVDALSLDVASGEFLVLVGPSGCGKSTTLRLIAGLETPTTGNILIDDRRVNDVPPAQRDIAMVFQSYALYPHMNVRENMSFALSLQKLSRDRIAERVARAAAMLGLEALLERTPRQLSGGQRQRVALGRAIVREPKVFLFDEPLSNLDAALRTQTRRELAVLHRTLGTTMVYVTHDQVEAMTLGQRIAVMKDGQLLQVDAPRSLYENPADRFVAGFIGSPGMNFAPAVVDRGAGGVRLEADPITVIPVRVPQSVLDAAGKAPVDLGVRPEDVTLSAPTSDAIPGRVEYAETLGSEVLAHVSVGAGSARPCTLLVRVATRAAPTVGAEVHLGIDASRVHLFHRETGRRLGI